MLTLDAGWLAGWITDVWTSGVLSRCCTGFLPSGSSTTDRFAPHCIAPGAVLAGFWSPALVLLLQVRLAPGWRCPSGIGGLDWSGLALAWPWPALLCSALLCSALLCSALLCSACC
ncbi:hypothetical protein CSOJ01_04206 [Colletotrichum sojae]|uniref:Uncharacterized protein n=1 Tax=Colletotrichum sojae TaxID=2175907 RepID=A0A8H6JJ82_9PEZI|nr:hypothetical protein CSOJ01_04206 [Colletotrichum sojae]